MDSGFPSGGKNAFFEINRGAGHQHDVATMASPSDVNHGRWRCITGWRQPERSERYIVRHGEKVGEMWQRSSCTGYRGLPLLTMEQVLGDLIYIWHMGWCSTNLKESTLITKRKVENYRAPKGKYSEKTVIFQGPCFTSGVYTSSYQFSWSLV